jgi:hypothetical protein
VRTFINLLLGIFLLVSVGVFVDGVGTLVDGIASSGWPTTDGTIVRSRMEVKSEETRGGGSRGGRGWKTTYWADVSFRYTIADAVFSSDTVTVEFDEVPTTNREDAERILRKYPAGREVKVYYEPGDPSVGVLEPGVSFPNVLGVVVGTALVAVTLLVMFVYNKYGKRLSR